MLIKLHTYYPARPHDGGLRTEDAQPGRRTIPHNHPATATDCPQCEETR